MLDDVLIQECRTQAMPCLSHASPSSSAIAPTPKHLHLHVMPSCAAYMMLGNPAVIDVMYTANLDFENFD